jgi:hypothetical protein
MELTMKSTPILAVLSAITLATASAESAALDGASTSRVTRSAGGFQSDRGDAPTRARSALVESETVPRAQIVTEKPGDARVAAVTGGEAWVYDAFTELFDDYDGDGYYTYVRVSFDVDSIYADHYVYARLFISEDGQTWDEYHVTDDFLIDGSSPYDDYEVETELVSGFPTGLYDILIEIYDADFGDFLADFGPADSSALSLLPLEEVGLDPPPVIVVTEEHGGGGAVDWLVILALASAALVASHKPRRQARVRARTPSRRYSDRNV